MVPVAHGGSAAVFNKDVDRRLCQPARQRALPLDVNPGKDTMVWSQNAEPLSLYCGDETDGETLRACEQIFDSLLSYKEGGVDVQPGLAEMPTRRTADLTEWTVKLAPGRQVLRRHGRSRPRTSWPPMRVQWDAANKLHVGNTGNFDYWSALFGGFLNPKPAKT